MSMKSKLLDWLSRLAPRKVSDRVVEVLRSRYADERQHAARFILQADKMRYAQFREALLRIAAEESTHADQLADKINQIGGTLPPDTPVASPYGNSWQLLLEDLEEERVCAAELETEMIRIESEYPAVGELLRHIDGDERKHRDEIRDMLMRSDPQALWAA
jgi:rubrerythrin